VRQLTSRRGKLRPIWLLNAIIATLAIGVGTLGWGGQVVSAQGWRLHWWALAPLFYVGELAVVHLRFRKDAHSFSMSEVVTVLGLFFATPIDLILGQALGNFVVLAYNRRQVPVKLLFNVSKYALEGGMAALIFRAILRGSDEFGPVGWAAALAATLTALLSANMLINVAILLTGGRVSRPEVLRVIGFGSVAASMNTCLGLLAALVISLRPAATWLVLVPPLIVFVAYRAYTAERQERARLEAIHQATQALHATPEIEAALQVAAEQALIMLEAEVAALVILPDGFDGQPLCTRVGPGAERTVMKPVDFPADSPPWVDVLGRGIATIANGSGAAGLSSVASVNVKEAILAPLRGNRGVLGALLVVNKLSDVATFEPQDLKLVETLASQVSVSLENGRLEDSLNQVTRLKERLEELVASKDQFVAAVSHELRTPLTAIIGLSEELRSNRSNFSDEDLGDFLTLIVEQSTELSHIIEDLLVAARADIGTLVFKPARLDVAAEVSSVLLAKKMHGVELQGLAPLAYADGLRFRQIIRNLLTNAVRYGGTRVHIELSRRSERVVVGVVDDGVGVSAGSEEAIFQPYQRDPAGRSNSLSVGLGLSVSRQLARMMGGDLVYRRRPHETVFELFLPLAVGPIATVAKAS